MPKVSVIVPNYNHAIYLEERISSILNQSFTDFELILLDDCSTDDSTRILQRYKDNKKVSNIVVNKKNGGSTFLQWKKGIELAKGEFIWIAESDDKAHPEFLSTAVSILDTHKEIGLTYSQSNRLSADGEVSGTWLDHTADLDPILWKKDFALDGKSFTRKYMLFKNAIPNASAVVFRRSTYDMAGGVDTRYKLNGDWLLYTKMLSISSVYYVSQPLNYFRFHSNKGSSKNIKNGNNIIEYYYILNDWKKRFSLNDLQVKSVCSNIFHTWMQQYNRQIELTDKNFIRILVNGLRSDPRLLRRIAILLTSPIFFE